MKKLLSVLLATLLIFAFTACGKTDSLEKIKEAGKIVMLTNASFPPYEYNKNGVVTGVDAELAQLIADEIGVELEIVDMNFDLLISSVKSGKGDIVAAGMSITEERQKSVDFSIPYIDTQLVIIVPEGSSISSSADLKGKKVAVQESTTSDLFITDNEDIQVSQIQRYKSAVEVGTSLQNGKIDAVVMDKPTAQNIVAAHEGLVILEEVLSEEQYAMAVPKGQEALMKIINKVLQKAVDEGKVEALIAFHMENAK